MNVEGLTLINKGTSVSSHFDYSFLWDFPHGFVKNLQIIWNSSNILKHEINIQSYVDSHRTVLVGTQNRLETFCPPIHRKLKQCSKKKIQKVNSSETYHIESRGMDQFSIL
jgi:hypothetical protein